MPSSEQDPQQGSSLSDPQDLMADFERAKVLIQQKAAEAKANIGGIMSADLERQRQIETQQEVQICIY